MAQTLFTLKDEVAKRLPGIHVEHFDYEIRSEGGRSKDRILGIDCGFETGPSARFGGIALIITVQNWTSNATIDFAGLEWAAPFLDEEHVLISDLTLVTAKSLESLTEELSDLADALVRTVQIGFPPSERKGPGMDS